METLLRIIASLVMLGICSWPYWVYQWVKSALQPVGFWQNLVMLFGGIYVLGGLQFMFAIIFLASFWFIWIASRK